MYTVSSSTLTLCVTLHQLVPQMAEEKKDQEAAEEMCPLLPERWIGAQRRSWTVRQLQASKLAQQLPSE